MRFPYYLVTLATLVVSAQNQNANFYSQEKETALGAELAKEVLRHANPIESGAVREYVAGIGRHLASQLPNTGLKWTITPLFDSSGGRTHEPVALPGGFVFVSSKLILEARSEAEFAGVLAHAMAHVSERHGTRMATRGEIANLSTIPLIFVGGWAGVGDNDYLQVPVGFRKFQRAFELDADQVAVRMMDAAGYDPNALAHYLNRALPSNDERIAALEQAIAALPAATYSSRNDEFLKIQEEVRRLTPVISDEPPHVRRPPSLYHQ